ncbi:uncharacterized protein LOC127096093 [Lathyrus oleraceus]|uniref:uncharacterized protein LOC127096093 n=1 Tax=Pisum sativum TaxID=3888 RepID=UPI0021CE933B|nr:uncharacterized protein LOC127096093 [Pisum sativum]
MDGFIDMTTISIYLTENLVPTLLAYVYYYLSYRHAKKKGMIACCALLLYQWFLEHLPKTRDFMEKKDDSWPQRLGSLRSSDLSWYSREYVGMGIIFSYGDFPNLPLIGTQSCINSNPVLSVRQLGYPMEGPPDANSLDDFFLLDLGLENPSLFQRIKEAWKKVNRKEKADLGRMNEITKESYFQWVRERVEVIKMPFIIRINVPLPEPKLTHIPIEESEELRSTIARLGKENEELQLNLQQVTDEKNKIKWELERKNAQLQENKEKVDKEEHKRKKVKVGIDKVDLCLDTIKDQFKQARNECQKNEHWWYLATKENKTIRDALGAQIKEHTISLRHAKVVAEREH